MLKITIRTAGVDPCVGPAAAEDIEDDFREHRPWHERATCTFADGALTLTVFNDFDDDGLALADELADCLSDYIPFGKISDAVFEIAVEPVASQPQTRPPAQGVAGHADD